MKNVAVEVCGRRKYVKKQMWITIEIPSRMSERSKLNQQINKREELCREEVLAIIRKLRRNKQPVLMIYQLNLFNSVVQKLKGNNKTNQQNIWNRWICRIFPNKCLCPSSKNFKSNTMWTTANNHLNHTCMQKSATFSKGMNNAINRKSCNGISVWLQEG